MLAMRRLGLMLALGGALAVISGCGVRSLPKGKNEVEATLAEITNQYKRRADLIPNLVQTVKGYAAHESETLQAVVEARAAATATRIDPANLDAGQIQKFQAAQGSLSQALGRLMVVVEKYPDLKADRNFRELQAQLEGTENRIAVARNRYIQSVQDFNMTVRRFPTNLTAKIFGHDVKPTFEVEDEAALAQPPTVEFGDDN